MRNTDTEVLPCESFPCDVINSGYGLSARVFFARKLKRITGKNSVKSFLNFSI